MFSVAEIITQCRSVAKTVLCFQRHLLVSVWVCVFVCLFVCQHDNFRTSKHRMMKPGGRCIVQKSRLSSNLEVIAPWVRTPKNVALGYDVWKISAGCLVFSYFSVFELCCAATTTTTTTTTTTVKIVYILYVPCCV